MLPFFIKTSNTNDTGRRNGGIGRHEGLKIPWPVMAVRVRVPLAALLKVFHYEKICLHHIFYFSFNTYLMWGKKWLFPN